MLYKHIDIDKGHRIFIFGDLHGDYDMVKKAKRVLGVQEKDIKIFLSDTIDRGKENLKCFKEAYTKDNTFAVMGNHEDALVKGFLNNDREYYQLWLRNGGLATLNEVGDEGCEWMAQIIKDVPKCLTITCGDKKYAFSHAGWPVELSQISPFDLPKMKYTGKQEDFISNILMWDRNTINEIQQGFDVGAVKGVDYIFHGHTFVEEPLVHHNRVYIDTGSVFTGNLTVCVIEPDNEMWFYSTGEDD